ncbi:MAG TPA: penicillin-binding transpeptidase domain-containing protein [Verrucomicrobiae bacterium]|nr:penicillin-binding transpeptidase domain-containing protein [Verrucomicrobiae bacterium]
MLIFDQLRRADQPLRWVAAAVLLGMSILVFGVWRVQVFSSRRYAESLKDQAFRNVMIPAPRGKILDRNGALLADNQPRYTVKLYLEDLRNQFVREYTNNVRKQFVAANPGTKLTTGIKAELNRTARYNVVSNIVWDLSSAVLGQPWILQPKEFNKHYTESLALPLQILPTERGASLTEAQVARFMERSANIPGVELEVEPIRVYPQRSTAVHLMGYVRQEVVHSDEEGIAFEDKTPVLVGKLGIEGNYDDQLRGKPGIKSILVNNLGYRQREEIWSPPLAGQNVTLTLDLEIQQAAERALLTAGNVTGPEVRGAAVVMDVRTGDMLAMASSPTYDPNIFIGRVSQDVYSALIDPKLNPMFNRVFFGSYAPGSTFKIITGLAAFDAGILDPRAPYRSPGYFMLGKRRIDDTAKAGDYDFKEAFKHSSNTYFIDYGLRAGLQRILEWGNQFGLGERTGVMGSKQEVSGYFPEPGQRFKKDGGVWMDGDTANLCIGQGEITVTPLQLAVMTSAIANGGRVFKPRVVVRLDGGETDVDPTNFPPAEIVHEVHMNPQHLRVIQEAMLADVAEYGGSGTNAFVAGFNICGKTGTAQVRRPQSMGGGMDHVTWFASYAPFEAPRYAVIVMVESGSSGGGSCAPKVGYIYKAIQKIEQRPPPIRVAGLQ